jgi:undecaprenyl-diphosphatase
MEETLRSIVLALLQGLTEFLPISSSAHLILPSALLGWPDQGLAFDVAVHVGSLLAVLMYYRSDLFDLGAGCWRAVQQQQANNEFRMVVFLAIASVPVGVAGLFLEEAVAGQLRSIGVIAFTTIFFGLLLGLADRLGSGRGRLDLRAALIIGLAQALAIIPGTSRSGITMTAALACGMDRQSSARFSFLLSIPVIAAAGALKALDLSAHASSIDVSQLLIGTGVAAITAYLTIAWFVRLLDRVGFLPFVIYRCVLGAVLFVIWW